MLDRLWKLLFGYVTIQADGMMLERFINACERAHVPLTALTRTQRLRLTAHICAHHMRRLFRIAKEMRIEIAVLSYHGLYALLRRFVRRPVLIVGICLSIFAGVLSTQFVLGVRVTGVAGEKANQVLTLAEQCGAKRGTLWGTLDQGGLQRSMEKQLDFAQKVLVHKRGVVMEIQIIPYVEGPPLFQKGDICDIVAKQDAVIESVIALEGTPVVAKGDVVKKGDVLIRGTYIRNTDEGKQRFVQARGIVFGRTAFMGSACVSLTAQSFERTGREQTVRTLRIAGWNIPLSGGTTFSDSILVHQSESLLVGSVLPATMTSKTYAEVKTVSQQQSYTNTEAQGIAYARADAQRKMPLGLTSVRETVYSELTEDGFVEVRVYITALVPIGMENKQMLTDPLLYIPKYW